MDEIYITKKELQRRLNSLLIQHQNLEPRQYGVSIKYYSQNLNKVDKRIDYKAKVQLKINNNGIGELEIDKKDILYNQHKADLLSELISDAISNAIYPVKTHYNEKGLSSGAIINSLDIGKRWEKEKQRLYEKYESPTLDAFFSSFENKLSKEKELEKIISQDWFCNLFFHPKLLNYGENRSKELYLLLTIIPYSPPICFPGIQKIEKIPTNYHSFQVEFQSKDIFVHPSVDNAKEKAPLLASLNAYFDLDLYHHFPMHTKATLEFYTKENERKNIEKKVVFTMTQLNTEIFTNKSLSKESAFITGGLVKIPKNKWGFDNFEDLENDW